MSDNLREDIEKQESAIVKHSNQLAEIPLQGFSAHEIDLFFGLCYFLQSQKDNEVTISFRGIRQLLGIKRRGDDKLLDELDEMSKKFSRISIAERSEKRFSRITPFIGFKADSVTKTFTVQAHPEFVDALNALDGTPGKRYTLSDVKALVKMNSIFSKQALTKMFLYRNTGYWYVSLENLRYYLSIPDSYAGSDIKKRVIDVIKKDFEESCVFDEFEITEKKDESKKTKGRKKVIAYTFHFKFASNAVVEEMLKEDVAVLTCPKCNKSLYRIERKDGSGFFFGHRDGYKKGAACTFTTNSMDVKAAVMNHEESPKDDQEINVSIGELDKYYAHIREQEQTEASERKAFVQRNRPSVWSVYEEWERMCFQFREDWMLARISNEYEREKREIRQKEIIEKRKELEHSLEKEGFDKDYLELRYRCKECRDTGITNDGMYCACRKDRAKEALEWLKKKNKG